MKAMPGFSVIPAPQYGQRVYREIMHGGTMTHPLQHLLDNPCPNYYASQYENILDAPKEIVRHIIAPEKPDDVPSATLDDVF